MRRIIVSKNSRDKIIEFVETEFQPRDSQYQTPLRAWDVQSREARNTDRQSAIKGVSESPEDSKVSDSEDETIRDKVQYKRGVIAQSNKAPAQVCVITKDKVHVTDFI